MPPRPSEEAVQTSIRFQKDVLDWVKVQSEVRGGISYASIINEALEDSKTYYHSAPQDIALLEREAEDLGLNRPQHIQYIIAEHRTKLLIEQAQAQAAGTVAAPLAKTPAPVVSGVHKKK